MATWSLDPGFVHLNHGSFGATPLEVLSEQDRWRRELEANPVSFMLETYQPALEAARSAVAAFVNCDTDGLVFVPNATFGVNSVARSLEPRLAAGVEIIVTNHGYNACNNAISVSADRAGARLVTVDIPFPLESDQEIIAPILAAVSERTALVVLDHVTSPTGIVFPIADLVARLEPEVPVLIDGAHAPGMLEVDLEGLGASFYTANCHKWMCAPKGSGFLHVAERHRDWMSAAVISHGLNSGWPGSSSDFHARFDWVGTDDPSARLSVGTAIDVMDNHHPDGWRGVRRTNHELVLEGRSLLANAIGATIPAPDSMIGAIASVVLPQGPSGSDDIFDPLMEILRARWKIEVPVFAWPDTSRRLIRVSAQQYNTVSDYERLAAALVAELSR
ncbi:MAG: aminotransferase class V-fold PLP-dependent enzyme [Acidimicrobiia bacterium]